jgi:hypothetical protein
MALPKPKHLAPAYGSQFSDPGVARAYRFRPPYPDEVYGLLEGLIVDRSRSVLELGCGLGEIARRLAARVERVEAVDPVQSKYSNALFPQQLETRPVSPSARSSAR